MIFNEMRNLPKILYRNLRSVFANPVKIVTAEQWISMDERSFRIKVGENLKEKQIG